VTGTPAPTRTQQWTLDGVDISGATGSTYTPITGDVGHLLRVRQIETNASGSANAVSASGTVAAATGTVSATDLTANRIYQRQSGAATVTFSGGYTSTAPTSIEVQLYGADGTTILHAWSAIPTPTISGGVWSGSVSVAAGGMYRFAVRSKDSGGVVIATGAVSSNLWGVGDLLVLCGSSSSFYWGTSASGTFTADANVRRFDGTNTWQPAGTGGAIITLANAYSANTGVPVAFIEAGVGGSTLAQWSYTSDISYLALLADFTAVGGKVAAVLVHVGSNDAANGTVASKAAHFALYHTFVSNVRSSTGQATLPFFVWGSNRRPGASDSQFTLVHEAEKDMGLEPYVHYLQTIDIEVSGDNVHPTAAGYQTGMARMQNAVVGVLGTGTYYQSQSIAAMVASGSTCTISLSGGSATDFTPTSAITGFSASDTSGALTVTSAVRTNASTITLTFNRAVSGTVVIKYLYGTNPIASGGGVFGNTTPPIPLNLETEMAVAVAATSATVALVNAANSPQASLSGLKWAFFDQATPDGFTAPSAKGASESTNGSGSLVIDITGTSLASGAVGWLIVTDSDGTTATVHKAFSGPVQVT